MNLLEVRQKLFSVNEKIRGQRQIWSLANTKNVIII